LVALSLSGKATFLACKFCDRIWNQFWQSSDAWERGHSNESELLSEESDPSWELIQQASAIEGTDAAAAFRLYLKAAEAGSIWAMQAVAWRSGRASGREADARAIDADRKVRPS
jgi:hypothetical protein